MLNVSFEHDTIRKYIVCFGNIFNDLYINRRDSAGNIISTEKVPLTYASKNKMLARLQGDPSLDRPVAMTLPRMSFEYLGIQYDANRKLNTIEKVAVVTSDTKDKLYHQYQAVPYNFMFQLYVMVKNANDGTKIIEQILPFFHPDLTVTAELIPELNHKMDIPIVLVSVTHEDLYEGAFTERRAMIWTLSFTLQGYIFGPTKKQPVIKKAITNLYATPLAIPMANSSANNSEHDFTSTITPGLTANGQPTSNASLTVPYEDIEATDNYGFVVQFDYGNS